MRLLPCRLVYGTGAVLTSSEGAAAEVLPGLNLLETTITQSKLRGCEICSCCHVLLIIYAGVKWFHGDILNALIA